MPTGAGGIGSFTPLIDSQLAFERIHLAGDP